MLRQGSQHVKLNQNQNYLSHSLVFMHTGNTSCKISKKAAVCKVLQWNVVIAFENQWQGVINSEIIQSETLKYLFLLVSHYLPLKKGFRKAPVKLIFYAMIRHQHYQSHSNLSELSLASFPH